MIDDVHVVLDDTAMVAAGSGNSLTSRLIHRASSESGWFLYAPSCALVEADRARRGTAEHIAALPGVIILDLDLAAALAVSHEATWAPAHALHSAQPTPDPALRSRDRDSRAGVVEGPGGPGSRSHPMREGGARHLSRQPGFEGPDGMASPSRRAPTLPSLGNGNA